MVTRRTRASLLSLTPFKLVRTRKKIWTLIQLTLAISSNDSTSEAASEAKGTLAISVTSLTSCASMCAVPSTVSLWTRMRDERDTGVVDIVDGGDRRKKETKRAMRSRRAVVYSLVSVGRWDSASRYSTASEMSARTA